MPRLDSPYAQCQLSTLIHFCVFIWFASGLTRVGDAHDDRAIGQALDASKQVNGHRRDQS